MAASVAVSLGAVSGAVKRATAAGLDWGAVAALNDDELEARVYPLPQRSETRPRPDCAYLHAERKKPGVTLELLHHEYLERHPDGYRYTQFCEQYRDWLSGRCLTMRQVHLAGEKVFVDYAGKKPHFADPTTGEVIEVELFVAVPNGSLAQLQATGRSPLVEWSIGLGGLLDSRWFTGRSASVEYSNPEVVRYAAVGNAVDREAGPVHEPWSSTRPALLDKSRCPGRPVERR